MCTVLSLSHVAYSLHEFSDDKQVFQLEHWMGTIASSKVGNNSMMMSQRAEHGNL